MTSILTSDIFFFITSIAVILISMCIIIICLYVIAILKDVKVLSQKTKDESERILEDIRLIREDVAYRGIQMTNLFSFLASFFKISRKRKVSKKEETEL